MLRLALKSLRANKIRFALTAGTVVVGVAFVVAAFVTADSLRSTFGDLATDINAGTDFTVRGALPFGEITDAAASPVPDSLVDDILTVDGVEAAAGGFFVDGVIPVDGSGEAPTTFGGPIAGSNWTVDESLSQYFLITGEWPRGLSEFAIDVETFANFDFELGLDYLVVTPTGPREFTLTGTMQFGFPDNAGIGAVFSVFDTATAQEVLGFPGQFNQISVRAEPGADLEAVGRSLASVLPDGTEAITSDEATDEFGDAFESFIGPFQTILLVFAFIVLFVSLFIISNTFNIVLGQRVRELSLLRAIGATPRQVRRSVLTESLLIGATASAAGLGLGMLGAVGMRALFSAFGASLPDGPLPLNLRTVVWAVAVGTGFTVMASLIPAVKASRVSPIAGLRDDAGATDDGPLRMWRPLTGGGLAAVGLVLTGRGLFAEFDSTTAQLVSLGAGAAIVFVAVAVLSPLVARAVVSALALPVERIFGTPGRLARENASRSPRRTAATAVALTIGLALVAMVSVVGQSLKDTFVDTLSNSVEADYLITVNSNAGLPKTLAEDLRATGVGTVVAFDDDLVEIHSSVDPGRVDQTTVAFTDVANIGEVVNLRVADGSLRGFDPASGLLVHTGAADDWGLEVGDEVEFGFVSGDRVAVTVSAVYDENAFWGDWILDQALYEQVATTAFDDIVTVKTTTADPQQARAALEEVMADYPQANLDDRQEFQESAESNLDTLLAMVNVFLLFALVVALVGIINTLTLSVFERTREIGLLRAVGMTRRQLRRMIRWEAATVALYGALVGLALGVAFGAATAVAIPDNIVNQVSVPVGQLALFVAAAVVFGLIAAVFPSYRAGRMNVLDAIASD